MTPHLFCKTDRAVLLLAVPFGDGPLRFPSLSKQIPGLPLSINPVLPVYEQLLQALNLYLAEVFSPRDFALQAYFAEPLQLEAAQGEGGVTLYAGTLLKAPKKLSEAWQTLPSLLQEMPKKRNRLAYLKAWQVLTGALELQTRAVELDAKELQKLQTSSE